MLERYSLLFAMFVFLSPVAARGDDPAKPAPISDKEAMAEKFSLEQRGTFSRHGFR